jgi:Na+/melibiose symporter-like transporter
VLAAEVVSNFGSMLSRLAIPWFAALTLTATPLAMGMLQVADIAAGAVAGLLLATFVDRRGKRAAMLAADVVRAGVVGLLAALAAAGSLAFWMLALAAAAIGMLTMTFEMARSAWMAQRLDAADLPAGNAQISAGGSLAETAAFAIGGWLYQWLGAVLALVVDAVSYLASALCLRGVAEVAPEPAAAPERSDLIADVRAGLRELAATPTLRAVAAIEILVALGMHLAGTSYMIFVARDLAFDTGTLGMIFATGGLGSLAGAALAPRAGRALGSAGALLLGLALAAVGAACIPLADASLAGGALLIAHQVIGDAGFTLRDVHDRTLRQTAVPAALLARVDGAIHTLGRLAALAGALGGGLLATAAGVRPALALSAALYAAAAAATWRLLVRRS